MNEILRSPKIKPWHLERWAVDYVRQSTLQQVNDHQESTARQYALADRAVELGWPRERVMVIDDDLGKSGQTVEGRPGFQRLLAEVALDHVGLILSLEMSRLARSCKDWHQLLELCARFRALLADADALYDPTDHNDRLLLGLHGMMSEAELHILKERMYQGKLNKARRGELLGVPPIGYVRTPARVGDRPRRAGPTDRPADLRRVRPPGDVARAAPLPGPPPDPHPGAADSWAEPRGIGVAAAEPGELAELAAPPGLCWGLPVRAPADRSEAQTAGAAEHRQADPTA